MGDKPKGVMKRVSEKTTNEILFENITIHRLHLLLWKDNYRYIGQCIPLEKGGEGFHNIV